MIKKKLATILELNPVFHRTKYKTTEKVINNDNLEIIQLAHIKAERRNPLKGNMGTRVSSSFMSGDPKMFSRADQLRTP